MMGDLSVQRFDGMAIDTFQGRFSGNFDCEATEVSDVHLDDELYFLVRARTKGAVVDETKSGDLRRTNVYQISDAVRIDGDTGFKLATAKNAQLHLGSNDLGGDADDDLDDSGPDDDIDGGY